MIDETPRLYHDKNLFVQTRYVRVLGKDVVYGGMVSASRSGLQVSVQPIIGFFATAEDYELDAAAPCGHREISWDEIDQAAEQRGLHPVEVARQIALQLVSDLPGYVG